ncbi:LPS translocon maturation chaperone LptM [Halothiobacillus sp. DCM-1]|uniref:LPS translocon maturation chaperone LptM n=1 Tax=Halothiobacillus sp. DCM-1 TaxID=3112558 RepID=UPI003890D2B4
MGQGNSWWRGLWAGLILGGFLGLTGCGQKGALVLPSAGGSAQTASAEGVSQHAS